jgi:hypothetical protein
MQPLIVSNDALASVLADKQPGDDPHAATDGCTQDKK